MTKTLIGILACGIAGCAKGPEPIVPETKVERQMIGLLEKFDRWDYNGDGYLSAAELKPAEVKSGYSPQKILGFYDTNHDGKISLKEAQAGMKRPEEAERKAKAL